MNVTMEEANAYVQSKAEAIKTKATEAQFAEIRLPVKIPS